MECVAESEEEESDEEDLSNIGFFIRITEFKEDSDSSESESDDEIDLQKSTRFRMIHY